MRKGIVLSFMSAKGGVGKSTSSLEVAALLTKKGYKTLLIDLDENNSLSKNAGADIDSPETVEKTVYEVFHAKEDVHDCIQHLEFYDILPGSKSLSKIEKEFIENDDNFLLLDLCEILSEDYDFIIVDNAPSRSKLLTMTIIAASYVICPTECDESSTDMILETESDIYKWTNNRHKDSKAKVIGYILSRYNSRTIMHNVALDTLLEMAGEDKFVKTISDAIVLSEAKTYKTSACLSNEIEKNKTKKILAEYNDLVDAILEKIKSLEG